MAEVPTISESAAPAAEMSIVDRISAAMSDEPMDSSGPPDGPLGLESAADAIDALDAPPPEQTEQVEPGEASVSDEDAPEAAAEAPEEDGGAPEEPSSEPEVEEYATLAEFAEKQGYDPEDLYDLPIGYTLDGEPGEFTLGEYKDRVKELVKLDETRNAFAEQKQAWETENQGVRQRVDENLHAADALLKNIAQEMVSQYNSTNWEELRADDPQEWAARRQEFQERSDLLKRAVQYGKTIATNHRGVNQELSQAELDSIRQREVAVMIEKRPSWQSAEVRQAEGQQAAEYLAANGWSTEELESTTDHRVVLMALKAAEFDKLNSQADVVKKKVRKIAKRTMAPGRARSSEEVHDDQVAAVRSRHSQEGSVNTAADAISQLAG